VTAKGARGISQLAATTVSGISQAASTVGGMPSSARSTYDSAESGRHLSKLRSRLDQLAAQMPISQPPGGVPHAVVLRRIKAHAIQCVLDHAQHLTISHTIEFLDEFRTKTSAPYGVWRFVRAERNMHSQMFSSLVGFARTATYTTIIVRLQERLVEKYTLKMERYSRMSSTMEVVKASDEHMARIMPYLDWRACRALPLSFMRGELRVEGLRARVGEATKSAMYASQTAAADGQGVEHDRTNRFA